jgi:hypothetical protein
MESILQKSPPTHGLATVEHTGFFSFSLAKEGFSLRNLGEKL